MYSAVCVVFSGTYHPAGSMHISHDFTDVQDTGIECPHTGVFTECPIPRWN